jgi:hypothetical protein
MSEITATITQEDLISVSSTIGNPAVLETMAQVGDVDLTELNDGSVLVYDSSTSKWVSTTKLEKQLMNGGFF